ncbi:hypothetical protein [Candidatus Colwellia aromaticivorans]|uniref:hypothetical protein n=1 Tax=Candidatus Colwellia aromaticivorans TaxID=2267621 RepID=UPI001B34CECD|nr:hypothetical protein [Candidatus Colwellia aromaticivorans]
MIKAHRGASGAEPENTFRAIKAKLDANVDGIEEIKTMQALGVDGVLSNLPTRSKSHLVHLSMP